MNEAMRAQDRTHQSNQSRSIYFQGREFSRQMLQEADFSGFRSSCTQRWLLLSGLGAYLVGYLFGFLATLIA